MRVCFVAGTLGRGGAERQLFFMLKALKAEGFETKLLSLTKGEAFEENIRALGIDIEWVGASGSRVLRLLRIIRAVRRFRPDIVQSAHFYTNIYVAAAGRLARVPSIGAVRNDLLSEIGMDRVFGRWQARLPGDLIANSTLAFDRLLVGGFSKDRVHLVKNVVDVSDAVASEGRNANEDLTVSFVGRLSLQKRPELFVRLAERLISDNPARKLRFRMVGDGPLRNELEELRDRLGMSSEALVFEGELSDLAEIYGDADVLVLTSEFEGTPNVILEAMARGIPVVATRVGGVPELLDGGIGKMVDPGSFEELCASVQELIDAPESRARFGQKGREFVKKEHSTAYLANRLKEIYQGLAAKKRSDD